MFELNHQAEIRALNVAKGKGDDAPVCVTIGLEFDSVGAAPVAAALGCQVQDLKSFFSESGENIFTGITQIDSWAEFEDSHKLTMLKFQCDLSKVNRVRIRPRGPDSFWLACNIQIQNPPEHVIETIAAHLHAPTTVRLDASGELKLEQAA